MAKKKLLLIASVCGCLALGSVAATAVYSAQQAETARCNTQLATVATANSELDTALAAAEETVQRLDDQKTEILAAHNIVAATQNMQPAETVAEVETALLESAAKTTVAELELEVSDDISRAAEATVIARDCVTEDAAILLEKQLIQVDQITSELTENTQILEQLMHAAAEINEGSLVANKEQLESDESSVSDIERETESETTADEAYTTDN